jgi:hypothetical protein
VGVDVNGYFYFDCIGDEYDLVPDGFVVLAVEEEGEFEIESCGKVAFFGGVDCQ